MVKELSKMATREWSNNELPMPRETELEVDDANEPMTNETTAPHRRVEIMVPNAETSATQRVCELLNKSNCKFVAETLEMSIVVSSDKLL